MAYVLGIRAKKKNRQMLEANEMIVIRRVVGKTKIDKIRSQQIRECCGIEIMSGLIGEEWNGTNK